MITDANGVPLGTALAAANIAETELIEPAMNDIPVALPKDVPVVADRGYDSDDLRERMAKERLCLLSPHRRGRTRPSRNDGRRLRRYRRRFVIERSNSWLHYYRRLANRWEYYTFMYQGFVRLACILIAFARL